MKRSCPHNRLSDAKVIEPAGTVWTCKACGSLIPEATLNIDMNFSPEWLLRVAKEEEDVRFSVGGLALDVERESLWDDDNRREDARESA